MVFMANIDYHIWQKFAVPAYITALLLSVAVLIVGDEYNGSKRWLSFGPLSFQPSEFAKIAVILFLACVITKNVRKMKKTAIFAVCDAFDFTDCRTCGGEQFKHRNHYSWNWRCACVCGKSKVRTICMALCQRRRIYGGFFWLLRVIVWNVWQFGETRKNMKKVIRHCRDCLQLAREVCLEEDLEQVCRSSDSFPRHKTI